MPSKLGFISRHIIEVKRSKYDEKKSDPANGKYSWIQKTYMDPRLFDYEKKWKFSWRRKKQESMDTDRSIYGFEPVTVSDPYVPEGATLDANKHWTFGDLLLAKCDLGEFLVRHQESRRLSDTRAGSLQKGFKNEIDAAGAGVPDGLIEEALGQVVNQEELKKKTVRDPNQVFGY